MIIETFAIVIIIIAIFTLLVVLVNSRRKIGWFLDGNTLVYNSNSSITILYLSGFTTLYGNNYSHLFVPTNYNYVIYNWIDDPSIINTLCKKYHVNTILAYSLGCTLFITMPELHKYKSILLDPPYKTVEKDLLEIKITDEYCRSLIERDIKAFVEVDKQFHEWFIKTFTIDAVRKILQRQLSYVSHFMDTFTPQTECHHFIAKYTNKIDGAIIHNKTNTNHKFFEDINNCYDVWGCYGNTSIILS